VSGVYTACARLDLFGVSEGCTTRRSLAGHYSRDGRKGNKNISICDVIIKEENMLGIRILDFYSICITEALIDRRACILLDRNEGAPVVGRW
jgi:hypothetical protein